MADNSILTPGYQEIEDSPTSSSSTVNYLEKDNYLSEFESEGEKAVVRANLNVPSKDEVYDKDYVDVQVAQLVKDAIQGYLNMEDPHGILPEVETMIENMVKTDGSTPFVAPQTGVDPLSDNHLTTKKFVSRLLKEHTNADDPHQILPEVINMLQQYVKLSQVYPKSQVYTKNEVDQKDGQFIKKDGTIPFTAPQIGVDPTIDSHLATKRYADKVLRNHLVDVDPHGFITILNNRLASYAKKKDVYDKTQTYSRTQIDTIIISLVNQAIASSIQEYVDDINDKIEQIRKQRYVKSDGTTAFINPQKGVDAIDDNDLVTLHQVEDRISEIKESLEKNIDEKECVWITSGPVESTVGHMEDDTPVPETMTFQEIMDAIFYGKGVTITVPEYVTITDTFPITVCVHGSGLINYAEIWQNGEVIYTLRKEDFEGGCVTVNGLPLTEDAEVTFKVYYTNGAVHEETKLVRCYLPVFVGLLPKWKFGNTITMDYLIELAKTGSNNAFLNHPYDLKSFTFKYNFQDPDLRHPFVVLPIDYPDLDSMVTKSQSFGVDAFDIIDMLPLTVPGVEKDMIFKVYIYRQALSSLNQDVTFNFTPKE